MSEMIQVPDGWEVKPFSSLATINMGQSPDSEFVNENQEGIAFLQGNAEFGDVNPQELYWVTVPKKTAKKDDILISVRAPVGDMNIADKDYCIGRGLSALTVKKINQQYSFYALLQERGQLDRLAQGSTFLAIGKNDFDKLLIKHPKEKKEQQKIAKILSTLDNAIESTNRLIEKEKNIKTALIQELLTNGIDKKGQIRSPQTHTYKQSELGLIPDEWEIKNIEDIADVFGGGTPDRSNNDFWKNGTVFWATPTDITGISNSNYLKDTKEKITEKGLSGSSAKLLPVGSILLTSRATIGERKISKIPVCTNQGFTSLVPKSNNGIFLYYILDKYISYMYSRAYGTTFPEISRTEVKKISIALPKCETEQKQITKILTTQDKKIQTEETNLAKLKELKKGLMNDLLNGKVRVKI